MVNISCALPNRLVPKFRKLILGVNCGPLSDTTCPGNPCAAKICQRVATKLISVVDLAISITSPILEWASTSNRNI